MNIHQMGAKLHAAVQGGTAYNFEIERYGTVVATSVKVRISNADGVISENGELRVLEHDRVGYVSASFYTGLTPPEPVVGDILIDKDHNDKRWMVVPDVASSAWAWHGTDETDYMVMLKES